MIIIVNIIAISLNSLLSLVIPYAILDNADIDDAIKTEVRLHYLVSFGICGMGAASCIEACVLVAFVSLVLGIMGAESNNEACVLVALIHHICNVNAVLFCRILGHDCGYYYGWAGVVLNAFFEYPHVMLLKELRNGRMTPHKDVHENQSCHWVNDDAV